MSLVRLLREIIETLGTGIAALLSGQQSHSDELAAFRADMNSQLATQAAAIEHLRVLIEGEEPTITGITVQEDH